MNEYDITAGEVLTPAGIGKYMGFDVSGVVAVEMDYQYVVGFPAKDCFCIAGMLEHAPSGT